MVAAAAFDLRTRRIPNALIVLGLAFGLAAQWWTGGGPGLLDALLGAIVALVVLIGPFALKALGGGDVKLAMVVGAWTNGPVVLTVMLYSALFTGVIAALFWSIQAIRPMDTAPRIPVALPLGVATILATSDLLPSLPALL